MTYTSHEQTTPKGLARQHTEAADTPRDFHVMVRDFVHGSMNQTGAFSELARQNTKFGAEISAKGLRQDGGDDKFSILFSKSGHVVITREKEDDADIQTLNIQGTDKYTAMRNVLHKLREITPEPFANGRLHSMTMSPLT